MALMLLIELVIHTEQKKITKQTALIDLLHLMELRGLNHLMELLDLVV